MPYSKPYLTVDQQLEKLKSRGLIVTDEDRAKAYLSRIGYYRLSGYWYPFRVSQHVQQPDGGTETVAGDDFRPGVEFRHIIELYVFDKNLRLMVLDAIERVEIGLRSSIALHLGRQGAWAHRDRNLLDGKFSKRVDRRTGRIPHDDWLAKLDLDFARSNEQFAKHFRSKYPSDDAPLWIATELWDFGMLSRFYAGMAYKDRKAIAAEYGLLDPDILEAWLRAINFLRNVCAHHNRLWNRALVHQAAFPAAGAIPMLDHLVGNNHKQTRLYGTAAAIRFLLLKINPATTWPARLKVLLDNFPTAPHIQVQQTGFEPGWHTLPLWQPPV
jgi:abortive infection bacteriophage resistance protein